MLSSRPRTVYVSCCGQRGKAARDERRGPAAGDMHRLSMWPGGSGNGWSSMERVHAAWVEKVGCLWLWLSPAHEPHKPPEPQRARTPIQTAGRTCVSHNTHLAIEGDILNEDALCCWQRLRHLRLLHGRRPCHNRRPGRHAAARRLAAVHCCCRWPGVGPRPLHCPSTLCCAPCQLRCRTAAAGPSPGLGVPRTYQGWASALEPGASRKARHCRLVCVQRTEVSLQVAMCVVGPRSRGSLQVSAGS